MVLVRCIAIIIACTWWFASSAQAQVELKNDGFAAGGMVAYQAGFCTGEAGAARFVAPEANRQLRKVRFLFGTTPDTKAITLKVWADTAGTVAPGQELFTGDYQVTGSNNGIVESDMTAENVVVPAQFRVGIIMKHAGLPSLARDNDGVMSNRNFVLTDTGCDAGGPFTWRPWEQFSMAGDFVIRAEISAGGVGPGDAGVTDAASGPPTGDPCNGNPQCPVGQYCNLSAMACTYDCTSDTECGDGTCNSLGQCVAGDGEGGGCGCQSNDPTGIWLGLVGLAWLARRRRR